MPWFTGTLYLVEDAIIFADVYTRQLELFRRFSNLAFLAENAMNTGSLFDR